MRKEAIKIKCPDRIQFGDPMYFEDYRNDPEKLQKLVVDYRPQPGFKAGVSLVETEHPEYPGFIARTMTIYFAPDAGFFSADAGRSVFVWADCSGKCFK